MKFWKYCLNEGCIEDLNAVASQVSEATDKLMSLTKSLESAASDYLEVLCPHFSFLECALCEINSAISSAKEPADEVSQALISLAQRCQDIIDDDPFK